MKKIDLHNFYMWYNENKISTFQIGVLRQGVGYYEECIDLKTVEKMIRFLKEYKRLYKKEAKNG